MTKAIHSLTLLFVLVFAAQHTTAQEIIDGHTVFNYATEDGLPNNQVLYSMQDSKGYMWFATGGGGVSRFDGTNFKTYDISNGLTDSDVFTIHEDHHGRLWFGTFNCQLSYLENDSIYPYEFNHVIKEELVSESIISRMKVTKEGDLFLFFINHQMVEISANGEYRQSKTTNSALCSLDVNFFEGNAMPQISSHTNSETLKSGIIKGVDRAFEVRIFEGHSITQKKRVASSTRQQAFKRPYSCSIVSLDSDCILFVNTEPFVLDTSGSASLSHIPIDNWIKEKILINTFVQDNVVWMMLENNGIVRGEIKNGKFSFIDHIFQNEFITHVHEDKDHGLWLGTINRGVLYIPEPESYSIRKIGDWQVFPKNLHVISDSLLIYAIGPKELLLHRGNKRDTIQLEIKGNDYITSILIAPERQQLVVLSKYSLLRFDISKSSIAPIQLTSDHYNGISGGNDIYFNPKDSLYTYTSSNISEFDLETNIVSYSKSLDIRVWSLTQLGTKWLFGSNTGLYTYEKTNSDWEVLPALSDHPIYNSYIVDFENHNSGTWIATTNRGLAFFKDSLEFTIGVEDGLASQRVNGLKHDGDTLWIATDKGLNKLILNAQGDQEELYEFKRSSGMSTDNSVGIECSERYIYVSNSKSVDRIPRAVFTGISRAVPIQNLTLKTIPEGTEQRGSAIELEDDQNHFAITFETIDFASLGEQEFRYRLRPKDLDWKNTSLRQIEYHGLASGEYHFQIEKKTWSGQWASAEELAFSILPPIWGRWWFICLSIATLFGFVYWRVRLREKKITRELEINRQVSDLREKALRAQVNPHFLFNTLNSIQKYILKGDVNASNVYLTKFSKLVRSILEGSDKEYITLNEEVEMLRIYLDLERMRASNAFDYRLNTDEILKQDDLRIPPMLVQPFVENAIWHGLAKEVENGFIEITFHTETVAGRRFLLCIIEDNGMGREASAYLNNTDSSTRKARGMGLTEERLSILADKSTPHVEVEDLYDSNGKANGTRVRLAIALP